MFTALLCTDGSELARASLAQGLRVIAEPDRVVLMTAASVAVPPDTLGAGIAGGMALTGEQYQRFLDESLASSREQLEATAAALGLENVEYLLPTGPPGLEICALAASLPASVIVLGTRGNSGIRRAVLGSVSGHVVRHAPCPVVITAPAPGQGA
ncbi:MAG: universal stress protein [Frankiaceae bacterium]|nr:universal stress protein [Frankiaceae bacterium]